MNKISISVAKLSLVIIWLATVMGAHAAPPTAPGTQAASATAQRNFIGKPANIPLAQSQDSDTVKTIGDLRKQAAGAGGAARIIVGVRVPFAAEGLLPASEATLQRNEIATAHANVLDKLPAFKQKSKTAKQFESIPFMAMEVTAVELEALLASTDVTTIEEDRPEQIQLAQSVPIIGGTSAWSSGYTGAGQTVAILDTGVDKNHPFLAGRVVSEACYSTNDSVNGVYSLCPGGATASTATGSALPYGTICVSGKCDHGTHVAGIAAGLASGGVTFSGVAKDASIIAIQVFSRVDNAGSSYCNGLAQCVLTWNSDVIAGLNRVYALRTSYSIASVNMSLGGGSYTSQATCDASNASRKAIIDTLRSVNIATVISSMNNGYTSSMGAPACISSAVSVGATWDSYDGYGYSCTNLTYPSNYWDYGGVDKVACYSNSASFLNLLAPGSAIYSSTPNNSYATYHGTSMAAPHVAGTWALLKQMKPTITVTEALAALTNTGQSIFDARNGISKPRINVNAALASLSALPSAPSIGTAVAGNGSVSVSFTPGAIGTGSWVTYWAACSKDGTTFVYGNGSASPVLVSSLTNGQTYACWAQTQSTLGYGPWSTVSNSVVVGTAGVPTSISAAAQPGGIRVSFVAPVNVGAGITGYTATCSAAGQATRSSTGSTSPITVGSLTIGVPYSCTVTANTTYGSSAASAAASATVTVRSIDLTPILMLLLD